MNEAQEVLDMIFIANHQTTKTVHPGKQPLDLPAPSVSPQSSAILSRSLLAVGFVWRDQRDACLSQRFSQRVAVIGFVCDQSLRELDSKTLSESRLDQLDFMRTSRFCVDGERKTSAVCHCQERSEEHTSDSSHIQKSRMPSSA